jgi:hypothetical protein
LSENLELVLDTQAVGKVSAATCRIARVMPSNQVNVEVDDLAWLVFCRGIVLILVAAAEEGVALELRAGQFDSVLNGTSIICSLC